MSKILTFTVALKKEGIGGYSVRCVELPAAISQGETEEEAILNIREAIELVLEELEERAARRAETLGQDPEAVRIPVDDWKAACTGAGMPRRTVYKVQETLTELSLIFLDHGYLSSEPSMCPCAPSIEGAQTAHRNTAEGHKVHANGTANGTQRAQPEEADGDVIE